MEAKLAGKKEEFNMEQRVNELRKELGAELDAQQIIGLKEEKNCEEKKLNK
ncbi:MAG: hypothetical protein CM15mV73_490 [Caudoviricetes sp.]|nr:MAG: hypothetical protein CM15mV73_490 [Caudoviricetes sp.]